MIRVKNKRTIKNLATKSFRANKTRNFIAIFAIALTAILFTTLFTMGIGTVDVLQQATMRQAGGDGHAVIKYITDEEFNAIKDHPLIQTIAYDRVLADNVTNKEFLKRNVEFWYYDEAGLKLGFCEPTSGHVPLAENEVIADSKTLELLGVPLEVGAPLTLSLDIHGQMFERDFILAGWWESDPTFSAGRICSSLAYLDAHKEELQNTYKNDSSITGAISAYIMFENSMNLEQKLSKIIEDSGYSQNEDAPNYVASNVNWSYLSTNLGLDSGTLISLLSGMLLVLLTGYLIIYNIFQISVIRDIRFYGLLKTIGTTGRQIRHLIRHQALLLSIMGIPLGLLMGYAIGSTLVPLIVSNSHYSETLATITPNPWIFIGSGLFSFLTVTISTLKPGQTASKISPIDAVKYTDNQNTLKRKYKTSKSGGRPFKMALSNLGRNKKRAVLVIVSLSLSLVLLNTVFTLSQSIDMEKFLSKNNSTDFLIANNDYFQYKYSGPENETSQSIIEAVNQQAGLLEEGRIYGGRNELFSVDDPKPNTSKINIDTYGNPIASVYGLEASPMNRMTLIDGEIDLEKLATGNYILEGVFLDDNGRPELDRINYAIGDTVTLHNYKGTSEELSNREYTTKQFTVLGHVAIDYYSTTDRNNCKFTFYLPSDIYQTLVAQPAVMNYTFNVSPKDTEQMEQFLQSYTNTVEPTMNYSSKTLSLKDFSVLRGTVIMIGGALSLIIGFIGILNLINSILTSILTRRQEFAMLQSIGMTRRQLRSMLMFEGLYYTVGTCFTAFLFGIMFSLLVVKSICGIIWFLTYHFVIWPLVLMLPLVILLGIIIPYIIYAATDTQSILERLREVN